MAEENSSEQAPRQRNEVFKRDGAKRRTSISLSQQADDDINELMRRSRQRLPGNVIADAVQLMRMLPPEFVALLLSESDKSEQHLQAACREMIRSHLFQQSRAD